MDEFMNEVRAYADKIGLKPSTIVQRAAAGNGSTWTNWEAGGTATHRITDRVRSYMRANPVPCAVSADAAA